MPAELHGLLVNLENDLNGVFRLMVVCESTAELGQRGEDALRFVAAHHWRDPIAVYDLVRYIVDVFEMLDDRDRKVAAIKAA